MFSIFRIHLQSYTTVGVSKHIGNPQYIFTVFYHDRCEGVSHLIDGSIFYVTLFEQFFPPCISNPFDVVVVLAIFVEKHIGIELTRSSVLLLQIWVELVDDVDGANTALCFGSGYLSHLYCSLDIDFPSCKINILPSYIDKLSTSHTCKETKCDEGLRSLSAVSSIFFTSLRVNALASVLSIYTDPPHKDCILYNTKHRSKKWERQEEIKRFSTKKKVDIVMDIFQGKTTVAEVSRKYDLTPAFIEEWIVLNQLEKQLYLVNKKIYG